MLLGYIAESFPAVFSAEQQQQQQQQPEQIPLSLWTAMRLVAMLGDDTRPEFEGKIAEVLGVLLDMMRQQRFVYELRSTVVGLVALFGRSCTARSAAAVAAATAGTGIFAQTRGGIAMAEVGAPPPFPVSARCFDEIREVAGSRSGLLVPLSSEQSCIEIQTAVLLLIDREMRASAAQFFFDVAPRPADFLVLLRPCQFFARGMLEERANCLCSGAYFPNTHHSSLR
jgi:hypothetical protein